MRYYHLILLLAYITLLTGCNTPAVSPVTPPTASFTLAPTNNPTPTPTSTPEATRTARPTYLPTRTPPPTQTKTPIPPTMTETPTLTVATETLTSTPDDWITATAIVKAVKTATKPRLYAYYFSPDKKWQARFIIYDCVNVGYDSPNAYEELRLYSFTTQREKVIVSQLQNCGGVGAFGLGGLYWAPSSRYFYYTDAREGWPDGGCYYWGRRIYRLDTVSLKTELIAPNGGFLSPDGKMLAMWQGHDLVIWHLEEGEINRIQELVPNTEPGPVAWSPDSSELAYLLSGSGCWPSGKSELIHFIQSSHEQSLLLESSSPLFSSIKWETPGSLGLLDTEGKNWSFDLKTQQLQSAP